ncbi:hypothetical protein C8R43DRAFT_955248 [Mycena crocata]|nr:hypothetical protein C8R43DRAFT_955248 [Mycena crocata]
MESLHSSHITSFAQFLQNNSSTIYDEEDTLISRKDKAWKRLFSVPRTVLKPFPLNPDGFPDNPPITHSITGRRRIPSQVVPVPVLPSIVEVTPRSSADSVYNNLQITCPDAQYEDSPIPSPRASSILLPAPPFEFSTISLPETVVPGMYAPQRAHQVLAEVFQTLEQQKSDPNWDPDRRISLSSITTIKPGNNDREDWKLQRPSLSVVQNNHSLDVSYLNMKRTSRLSWLLHPRVFQDATYPLTEEGFEQVLVGTFKDADQMGTYHVRSIPVHPLAYGMVLAGRGVFADKWVFTRIMRYEGDLAYIWCRHLTKKRLTFMRRKKEIGIRKPHVVSLYHHAKATIFEAAALPGSGRLAWAQDAPRTVAPLRSPRFDPVWGRTTLRSVSVGKRSKRAATHPLNDSNGYTPVDKDFAAIAKNFQNHQAVSAQESQGSYQTQDTAAQKMFLQPYPDPFFDEMAFASADIHIEMARSWGYARPTKDYEQVFTHTVRDASGQVLHETISVPRRALKEGDLVEFRGSLQGKWEIGQLAQTKEGFVYLFCNTPHQPLQAYIRVPRLHYRALTNTEVWAKEVR